jgi:hypothetical protein
LTDYEAANRKIAVEALSAILPDRKDLLASLRRTEVSAWNPQSVVRKISAADRDLRAEILRGLESSYPEIRQRAARVGHFLPEPGKEILSQLVRLKDDPDPRVRLEALEPLMTVR